MYPPPPAIIIFFVTGMHRKSMEATQSLGHDLLSQQRGYDKEDEEGSGSSSEDEEPERKPKIDEKDDFRSSSIAALRAKAQAGVNILLNIRKKKTFQFFFPKFIHCIILTPGRQEHSAKMFGSSFGDRDHLSGKIFGAGEMSGGGGSGSGGHYQGDAAQHHQQSVF